MELTVIVICVTAVIITFFVYMLFKDKADGQVEWDTKTGKLKLTKSVQKVLHDKQEEVDNIVDYYKQYKSKSNIEQLNAYKDFCFAIAYSTISIYKEILKFLRNNNITEMGISKYNEYILEKIKFVSATYDEHFRQSKNELVKNISIRDILGSYRTIARQMIKDFFKQVYDNHAHLNNKRKDYILKINEQTENPAERLSMLYSLMFKDMNEALDNDEAGLYSLILEINNVLIGLWHDILLEYIFEEKNK